MIISGLQTGNTRWLAAHLQNAADNESIEIAEVTGTVATDIDGALAEFDAITAGTRAREGVYAAFINPSAPLTRKQYLQAIDLIAERLGLAGQPRIILFHVKNGREHCHIVWSRIDWRRMRAIQLSHDRQKLRRCAQDLAAMFGHELPPGLAQDRGAERFADPPPPTRAEKAMEASSGLSREQRRDLITACYRSADTADAFAFALEAAGFMLARGDKRSFVVVDIAGDVHSLARQIDGAKTKDVKKKLEGVSLSLLPPVEKAKALMLQRAAAEQDGAREKRRKDADAKEAWEPLQKIQKARRAELDRRWQAMKIRQMHEWKVLLAHIRATEQKRLARRHWLAVGLALYLKKITFLRQLIEYYEKRRKRAAVQQYEELMEAVRRRHDNEAAELRRRYDALARLERGEWRSFAQSFGAIGTADTKALTPLGTPYLLYRVTIELGPMRFGNEKPVDIDLDAVRVSDYRFNADDITAVRFTPGSGTAHPGMSVTVRQDHGGFQFQTLNSIPSSVWEFRENAADVTQFSASVPIARESISIRLRPQANAPPSF